jgi:thioredoxin reductase
MSTMMARARYVSDGTIVDRSALFVTPRIVANHEIIAALGAETEHTPPGTWVKTDASGRTSVPGVWAAGNVAGPAPFVI